jgi:hypothetical protein
MPTGKSVVEGDCDERHPSSATPAAGPADEGRTASSAALDLEHSFRDEAGECRHGICNPAWCGICSPRLVMGTQNR